MKVEELLQIREIFAEHKKGIFKSWAVVNDYFVYNSYDDKKECAKDFKRLKLNPKNKNIRIEASKEYYAVWYPYYAESFE